MKKKFHRGVGKSVEVTAEVAAYVDGLLSGSESNKNKALIAAHDTGDRTYLHVPYSQARFLEIYAMAMGARKILEVGTFKGFSTAFLARGLPADGKVITIDEDKRYVEEAETFWKKMNVGKKIEFKLGLAEMILKEMASSKEHRGGRASKSFDLVFIDADKENYKKYFEYALKMTRKGGSILLDNTLWRGLAAASSPEDNGARHVQAFNKWLHLKYGRQATIVPAWDGVTIVVKK